MSFFNNPAPLQAPIAKLLASFVAVAASGADEAQARPDIVPSNLPKVCMTVDQALKKAATLPKTFNDVTDTRYRLHPALYEQAQTSPMAWMYLNLSFTAARVYEMNPVLFANQMFHESDRYNPRVIAGNQDSRTGAKGVSQIQPDTGSSYGMEASDYTDPQRAIFYGARIKCDTLKKYRGDEILALVGYNGGVVGKKKGDPGPVTWAAWQMGMFPGMMTGERWLEFNEKRNKERNNEKKFPSAWHNETLKYVKVITGANWPGYMVAKAEKQQGEGYLASEIDTQKFWASMYKDQGFSLVALAYAEPDNKKEDPFTFLLREAEDAAPVAAFKDIRLASVLSSFITQSPVTTSFGHVLRPN